MIFKRTSKNKVLNHFITKATKLRLTLGLDFSRIFEVFPVLVGDVLEDVFPTDGQNSGQHFHRMFVANVEELVNRTLNDLEE